VGISLLQQQLETQFSTTTMAHKTPEFEQLVQKIIEDWKVPGLSIAVIRGDEIYSKVVALP
jgi:CubicO group peptidase (beta-lactamase class C family)